MVKTPLPSKVKSEADTIQVSKRKYLFTFLLSTVVSIGWFLVAGLAWGLAALGGAEGSYLTANIIYWGVYLFIILAITLFFRKVYRAKILPTLMVALLPGIIIWTLLGIGVYTSKKSLEDFQIKRVRNLQKNVHASSFEFKISPLEEGYFDVEIKFKIDVANESVSFSNLNFGILDKQNQHLPYEGKDENLIAIYIDRLKVKYRLSFEGTEFQVYDQRNQHNYLAPGIYDFEVVFERWIGDDPIAKLKNYQFVVFIPTGELTRIKSFDFEDLQK